MKAQTQIDVVTKSIITSISRQIESVEADKNINEECKALAVFELRKTIDTIRENWSAA